MSEERFISRQISKYATTKKLIEFNDKMRLPPVEYYAHVQATGDKNHEGKNVTSLIGITMLDYSSDDLEQLIPFDVVEGTYDIEDYTFTTSDKAAPI